MNATRVLSRNRPIASPHHHATHVVYPVVSVHAVLFALIGLVCVSAIAAEPSATPSPSASPAASESPAATLTQSVSQLSAQSAAAERSKIYRTGVAYSRWLD